MQMTLYLTETQYVIDLLSRFGMVGVKLVKSLATPGFKFSKEDGDILADDTEFRQLIGSTLQCLTMTHADLSYAVNQLSQFLHTPRIPDIIDHRSTTWKV